MKNMLVLLAFLFPIFIVGADVPFTIPKNTSFPQSTQITAKEVRFEVDESNKESLLSVNEDTYISIDCEHLILDGLITFKNATEGDNINGIKIEIKYKTLSGTGKIVNGIKGFKGNVTFIFTQK